MLTASARVSRTDFESALRKPQPEPIANTRPQVSGAAAPPQGAVALLAARGPAQTSTAEIQT